MVAVSGNTGSAPLIGSKVIRDRVSNESVWSEKGSSDPRPDAKSDANCVRPRHQMEWKSALTRFSFPLLTFSLLDLFRQKLASSPPRYPGWHRRNRHSIFTSVTYARKETNWKNFCWPLKVKQRSRFFMTDISMRSTLWRKRWNPRPQIYCIKTILIPVAITLSEQLPIWPSRWVRSVCFASI